MRFTDYEVRDRRTGLSLVFVGLGFMGFLAASMLAIDVGMLMTARSQAQNAADAGALPAHLRWRTTTGTIARRPDRPWSTRSPPRKKNKVMGEDVTVPLPTSSSPTTPAGKPTACR